MAAAKVVLGNDQLREHFTEEDGMVNITRRSVDTLKEKDPDLHRKFQLGVVSEVTRNGLNTVATPEIAAAKALDNPAALGDQAMGRQAIELLAKASPTARNDVVKT